MHERGLKGGVILDAPGIVEEWIDCGGGVEKWLITSNRSISIKAHDAHFPCGGENCGNVAGGMHGEINQ